MVRDKQLVTKFIEDDALQHLDIGSYLDQRIYPVLEHE